MLQSNISLPVSKETSALGIFYLIGISNNVWTVENLIPDFPAPDQIKPEISKIDMNKKYKK
jgi:glycerol kinase